MAVEGKGAPTHPGAAVNEALWDLDALAEAEGLARWMFEQFRGHVQGRVIEVGAGVGTYSERILERGATELLLVEPDPACLRVLRERYADHHAVTVVGEVLPGSPAIAARAGQADFVLCQNVLEHIVDDRAAVAAMAAALKPGGVLGLLVPAHPRLYGRLDELYGHERRYTRDRVQEVVSFAGLELVNLHRFNALGIAGWLAKSLTRDPELDPRSLRAYEAILPAWRRLEDKVSLPVGLSLVATARKR